MKTFETEKHNIPEGATHYSDSSDERYFSWFMHTGDEWFIQIWSDKDWVKCKHNEQDKSGVKPIPKTKEVEWLNGDVCFYTGEPERICKFVAMHPNNDRCAIVWEGGGDANLSCVAIDCLSKPETEAERIEREELEVAYDLYAYISKESLYKARTATFEEFNKGMMTSCREEYLAIVRKTGCRKEGE